MRLIAERTASKVTSSLTSKLRRDDTYDTQKELYRYAVREKSAIAAREFFAASKLQALVRGVLTRLAFAEIKERDRAVRLIQRLVRGKLGRIRWKREYWKSQSVVKSEKALQEIIKRSIEIRVADAGGRGGNLWKEMFDPLSNSFWYYNPRSKMNIWQCPPIFQNELVCHWDGFKNFGAMPSKAKRSCRAVFKTVSEYQQHLKTAHKWYCTACDHCNSGMNFPHCSLCGNVKSSTGEDGQKALQSSMAQVRNRIAMFLSKDHAKEFGDDYVIKDRLIEAGMAEIEKATKNMSSNSSTGSKSSGTLPNINNNSNNYPSSSVTSLPKIDNQSGKTKSLAMTSSTSFLPDEASLPSLTSSQTSSSSDSAGSASITKGGNASTMSGSATNSINRLSMIVQEEVDRRHEDSMKGLSSTNKNKGLMIPGLMVPLVPTFEKARIETEIRARGFRINEDGSNTPYDPEYTSIASLAYHKEMIENEFEHDKLEFMFQDPVSKGLLPSELFDFITNERSEVDPDNPNLVNDLYDIGYGEEESGTDRDDRSHNSATTTSSSSSAKKFFAFMEKFNLGDQKLLVCKRYTEGKCKRSNCPLAHPGIRDSAQLQYARIPGKTKKVPYCKLCPYYNGNGMSCPQGRQCTLYHIYVRPSTQEIILRLYPIEKGEKTRVFESGATLDGSVRGGLFCGRGVMTWTDGSTYCGDWKDGIRDGFGIFRSYRGMEYIGQWKDGRRHGWGVMVTEGGDEYLGQWVEGRIEGLGRLAHLNGDVYEGEWLKNLYHGVGTFTKKNGDRYMGYFFEGRAQGLGVLALSQGDKYKGYFDRNFRHGKGVQAYANGSRYAGDWYRGVPQGFGIFVSPQGEKYVGQWAAGKKHGIGRYYFENFDFYDGEFFKNIAKGKGVYYHNNGNIYSGEWDRDKRNGRGTYIFANGSKYTGFWLDNDMHGKGKFDYANGNFFRGTLVRNKKHGKGEFTWYTSTVFRGDFVDDKICGNGDMKYFCGHRYSGQWANNKKNGKGTFYYACGHEYQGDWVDDIRHGVGVMKFLAGTVAQETYEGDWVNDEIHGFGKYTYRDDEGVVYEGQWIHGRREGKGIIRYRDGSYYRGDFHNEQMWGEGVYVGTDGYQYDGEWRLNMRQGIGTEMLSDGNIYHGEFWANMKHGKGKMQHPDGTSYEGTWEGNVILGKGKFTVVVGKGPGGGPSEIVVKVFGY